MFQVEMVNDSQSLAKKKKKKKKKKAEGAEE